MIYINAIKIRHVIRGWKGAYNTPKCGKKQGLILNDERYEEHEERLPGKPVKLLL